MGRSRDWRTFCIFWMLKFSQSKLSIYSHRPDPAVKGEAGHGESSVAVRF